MRALFANYAQIMRNDFKDYARTFADYAHLPRKVVNNDVSSELPTISK